MDEFCAESIDLSKSIAENYDVLAGEYDVNEEGNAVFNGNPVAYRGLFLIDKAGVVRHQVVNDLPLGRSVDEALRMVDALNFTEEHGEVCPADWKEGEDVIVVPAVSTEAAIAKFPKGVKVIKPYLRYTPQPNK